MNTNLQRRKLRVRSKLLKNKPRLTVYKSNRYISAQIIDDSKGQTLAAVSSKIVGKLGKLGKNGVQIAKEVGLEIARKAKSKKVNEVVFDKSGYKYHGKVKALAEGAREGGLHV